MSVRLVVPRRFSVSLVQALVAVCVTFFLVSSAWAATKKTLYTFEKRQGAHPWGTMVFDPAGNLYGTTQWGGIVSCGPDGRGGCGTVFQLSPQPDGTWKQTVLHKFAGGTDGALVYSGVIFDAAGNLYGTTTSGGDDVGFGDGTAFELSPNGWTETLLHIFAAESGDGAVPIAPLTFDKSGNLYGTTYRGLNPCGYGTVFELSPNPQAGWTENVLHCFSGGNSDGSYPSAPVIFDEAGNLYSTTYLGGTNDDGTVFQLVPSGGSWTENILYNFGPTTGGSAPDASLVFDKNGNLFGLTYGSIFELTPSGGSWTYTTIYSDKGGLHGIAPTSLLIDQAGNLYGTAIGGSSSNCHKGGCGAVFKVTHGKKGWHLKVLYSFQGGTDGEDPYGGLVMDQQGNLYGTTYYGGETECVLGCGLVFEITP